MCFGQLFRDWDIGHLQEQYLLAKERASTHWYDLMKHRINVTLVSLRISTSFRSPT